MQAIAREDKGILGKDWNKSDKTFYRTTSYNPTVAPEERRAGAELSYRGDPAPSLHSPKVFIRASNEGSRKFHNHGDTRTLTQRS